MKDNDIDKEEKKHQYVRELVIQEKGVEQNDKLIVIMEYVLGVMISKRNIGAEREKSLNNKESML